MSNQALVKSTLDTCTTKNSRDLYGLTVLKNNHKAIKKLRKDHGQPTHHGNKVWDASIVLMDYFKLGGSKKSRPIPKKSHVLEIGCGWAITALYCAKSLKCEVAGLDIDSGVLPFATLHGKLNGVHITGYAKSYEKANKKFLSKFDVVVGGDICFWDELEAPLYNLMCRASKKGVRVILADPGRSPFMNVAETACKKLNAKLMPWYVDGPHEVSQWVLDTGAN